MDVVIGHVQENMAAYAVVVFFVLPTIWYFRKWTFPFIYHSIEYVIYCTAFHVLFGGILRVFSWYRVETRFKNFDGSLSSDYVELTNPMSTNFWMKELYSPQWLFYVEVAAALGLLYIVVCIRPIRYKNTVHKKRIEKPLKDRTEEAYMGYDVQESHDKMAARRASLQKSR